VCQYTLLVVQHCTGVPTGNKPDTIDHATIAAGTAHSLYHINWAE